MLETATVALTTLFAVIGPLDVCAMFAGLTSNYSPTRRRQIAVRGVLVAGSILLTFALVGEYLLAGLGISLAALQTAGGILLLLIGIDMVFVHPSGGTSTTDEEEQEALAKRDISIFPLATPLIAGPGAMGAIILLMANADDDIALQLTVLGCLLGMLLLMLIMLLLSSQIQRLIGVTAKHVVSRVMGVLLSALAVQFVFDGIAQSGLLTAS